MTSIAASGTAEARDSNWRLVVPFGLVVLGALALFATFGFVYAQQSDLRLQQQRRASLLGALDEIRTVFAELATRRAYDIAAVAADSSTAVPTALEAALVPSGIDRYRHDAAYLVDGAGRVLAAFPPGTTDLPAPLARLIGHDAVSPTAEAASGTDFILMDGQPAVAAVAPLHGLAGHQSSASAPAVLVTVGRLDSDLTALMERTAGVEALRINAEPVAEEGEVQSLIDSQGRIVGWLAWRGQYPMGTVMIRLSPLLVLVMTGLIGFAMVVARQLRRSRDRLADSKAEVIKIANVDPLTGLPNRRTILDELDRLLQTRGEDRHVCYALLDLDGFKDVNEALGHLAGDQLLIYVAERLQTVLKGQGMVARLGGDEFAMIVDVATPATALQAANAAVTVMARPFWLAGQALQLGLTVGLAQAPMHGETRDELTRRADLALRAAKQQARGRTIAFESDMEVELNERRFVNRELPRTLAEGGLDVHYQPIVAADGQRVVGVEALLRWRHPVRGDIPPMVFVPVAEQTGLMPKLGEFVLRRALSDARHWPNIYIAVNLSPVQVRDRSLVDLVASVLRDTGIEPERVVMEVTEGVLIENPDDAKARLESLRALGVKIALDDFGSGYSSLSYLRRFPIDKLKIDKEFVAPLGRSANGGVIIQAIMALGRALGLTVLCEGVETEEQRILLRLAGCDEMQGFLFARPGPARGINRLLAPAVGTDTGRPRRLTEA